ncbi:MAG TPA: hypothetical protein VIV60_15335 [Polyangiaceae bacterium]
MLEHQGRKFHRPLLVEPTQVAIESVNARHRTSRESTEERVRSECLDPEYPVVIGYNRVEHIPEPGLYIETQGALEDPDREERPARSLRGVKAGRIVRALLERKQPPGVRELATVTKSDAGYVSRVLSFLDSEALVTRVGRGRIQSVDWPALLRRWAQEVPLDSRGIVHTYLEPRGQSALLSRLAASNEHYVLTGSVAATTLAPSAPERLATLWTRDASMANRLGLRPADSGANVLLIEPNDDGVFDGAVQRDGLWYAAPSQIAADLLTSPGRGPSEGEAQEIAATKRPTAEDEVLRRPKGSSVEPNTVGTNLAICSRC